MIELRIADISDAKLLFRWANEEQVRKNSIQQEKIVWKNHLVWLQRALDSPFCEIFILEKGGSALGQIRIEYLKRYWEIDYSIDKSFRGKGYGKIIVKKLLERFPDRSFKAKVKESNLISSKIFESLSFRKVKGGVLLEFIREPSLKIDSILIASNMEWNKDIIKNLKHHFNQYNWFWIQDNKLLNVEYLLKVNPKYIFFPHWSFKINASIHENFECILFHMTDLPYGRGGSPLQNLILEKKERTKISAIKVESEIDSGAIYLKKPLELHGNAQNIFSRASVIIEEMISEILLINPIPKKQEGVPSFFKRRKPSQSEISDLKSIDECYDFIRMLDSEGYPKAFFETDNLRFEFENAQFNTDTDNLIAHVRIFKK